MNRPALCLVPGWGFDDRVWRRTAEALEAFSRPQVFELPYMPGTSLEERADKLLHNAPAGAWWLGWSLGAVAAALAAARHPSKVAGLVLVCSSPVLVDEHGEGALSADLYRGLRDQVRRDPAAALRRFAALCAHGAAEPAAVTRMLRAALSPADAAMLLDGLDLVAAPALRGQRADCPALLIEGEGDTVVPAGQAPAWAKVCGDLLEARLPRAGHAPFLAQPQAFVSVLRQFLHERQGG